MTKLKKYNTIEDWETAKSGLVYPSVGLVGDGSVVYMTPPLPPIHTLPIKAVFYDSATGSFVKMYPDEITEAIHTYTPIGVEVVPAEHDVYSTGQAGIMSLAEMGYNTPDIGVSYHNQIYYGDNSTDTSLPNYNVVNYIGVGITLNDGVVQGTTNYAYLPSDQFSTVTGLDGKSGYYSDSMGFQQVPSPYNSDGSRNEAYYTTAYSTANALSDFDGIGNTAVLTELATAQSDWKTAITITNNSGAGYYPAACCCWRFHTAGTDQGQWYLPACGELGYVINRLSSINETINKVINVYPSVKAVAVNTGSDKYLYWSSSESGGASARSLYAKNGIITLSSRNSYGHVRAFLRI